MRRLLVVAVVAAAAASGCAGARRDAEPMVMLSPAAGSSHGLPLTVRWTPVEGAAGYVLFVNRAPVAPGAIAPPRAIDVLVTARPEVELDRMMGAAASEERDHHLVAVAVDDGGRRLGERAAVVDVRIDPLATDVPEGRG